MEPKFQTSFIPKTPITPQSIQPSYSSGGSSFNILKVASVLLFVLVIVASGGVFVYESRLLQNIESSKVKLVEAKTNFDSPENQKILLASNQLKSIKELLNNHVVVSPLFQLLEEYTLPTVRLTDFEFKQEGGVVSVIITAEAQSYASLAQQSRILSEVTSLKEIIFNEITLTDTGTVETSFTATIDPALMTYNKQLQSVSFMNTSQ